MYSQVQSDSLGTSTEGTSAISAIPKKQGVDYTTPERIAESLAFLDNLDFLLSYVRATESSTESQTNKTEKNENKSSALNDSMSEQELANYLSFPDNLCVPPSIEHDSWSGVTRGRKNDRSDELIARKEERTKIGCKSNKMVEFGTVVRDTPDSHVNEEFSFSKNVPRENTGDNSVTRGNNYKSDQADANSSLGGRNRIRILERFGSATTQRPAINVRTITLCDLISSYKVFMLYCIALYCIMSCCVVLCYFVLCCVALCCFYIYLFCVSMYTTLFHHAM